jgi:predicted NAD/FAD-dependent oxidoreductase
LHWHPSGDHDAGGEKLLQALKRAGVVEPEPSADLWLGELGLERGERADRFGAGAQRWRGRPSMDALAKALLALAGEGVDACFGVRVQQLQHSSRGWQLMDAAGTTVARARTLVLSGNLLAHPRSLAMLGLNRCPLRQAVAEGVDSSFDQTLAWIAKIHMEPRWNRMLACACGGQESWPRQVWLTPSAAARWQLERLVFHPQADGRMAIVVHGCCADAGSLPSELLAVWPALANVVASATDLGVMRWGAARPLDHPLPSTWQWNDHLNLGLCGDWIEGPGFASAQGAISSGDLLAQQMLRSGRWMAGAAG